MPYHLMPLLPPRFSKGELLGSCELPPSLYFSAAKADLPLLPLPGLSAKQNRHVQGELSASFWLQVRAGIVRGAWLCVVFSYCSCAPSIRCTWRGRMFRRFPWAPPILCILVRGATGHLGTCD